MDAGEDASYKHRPDRGLSGEIGRGALRVPAHRPPAIGDLSAKGVGFFVCNNTLVSRNIDASKVAMEAKVVPSGVAEVARLQAREGYVYLRP